MIKKDINQNEILNSELLNSFKNNYTFNNSAINRYKSTDEVKIYKNDLKKLKNTINTIQDCDLKKNSTQIVFGDGDIDSKSIGY